MPTLTLTLAQTYPLLSSSLLFWLHLNWPCPKARGPNFQTATRNFDLVDVFSSAHNIFFNKKDSTKDAPRAILLHSEWIFFILSKKFNETYVSLLNFSKAFLTISSKVLVLKALLVKVYAKLSFEVYFCYCGNKQVPLLQYITEMERASDRTDSYHGEMKKIILKLK